jgi:hypothetical protein
MGWQEITALSIVAGTAGVFLWNRFRRKSVLSKRHPCCCPGPGSGEQGPSIVFHAKKGERPKVVVKLK